MRTVAATLAVLAVLLAPGSTGAAEVCPPATVTAEDMAGVYESREAQIRLAIHPCGALRVLWSNTAGTHEAFYAAVDRVPSGGLIARVAVPDPYVRSLDGRVAIGVSPAEPGYVTVLTLGPFGEDARRYRLAKLD